MSLKRIRLELARGPEHPEGSPADGYEFVTPLTADGHLDPDRWRAERSRCRVRRFRRGEADETATSSTIAGAGGPFITTTACRRRFEEPAVASGRADLRPLVDPIQRKIPKEQHPEARESWLAEGIKCQSLSTRAGRKQVGTGWSGRPSLARPAD